jgi:UDP-GlcNAc:undecaprenyl-phosphate GlcNAc-1-phosphate transferase
VGAIAAVAMAVVAVTTDQLSLAATALALAGALLGFTVFNFHPARIYLGDAGSLATGITLGAIALAVRWSDQSPAGFLAPPLILVVPLADTAYVSVLRARAGRPFWHGSPDHFPLRLRRALGGRVRPTVAICSAIPGVGAAIGVGNVVLWGWQASLIAAGALAAAMLALLAYLARIPMEPQ